MEQITLPKRADGTRDIIGDDSRCVTIIGANGAGKTRFTEALIADLSGRSFRVSALHALYGERHPAPELPGSIDELYRRLTAGSPLSPGGATSQWDRTVGVLMWEEVANLIAYKVESAMGKSPAITTTKLDKVIALWQEIFPGNRILLEGGRMLFSRALSADTYASVKLSDGERAVLYYIGASLLAMDSAVIFVDNPGMFLHPTVGQALWDRIEALRPDCRFVYTTHDLDFAGSRTANTVVWVRDYDAATVSWDYDLLPPHSGIPDDIYMAIIGARKPVMFIEGDDIHSIDSKLYPLVFTGYTVKALGSCNKVIETTRTFNDMKSFHHLDSYGIVDRDRRDSHEVDYLRQKKILVPNVAEVENLLMLEEVVKAVAASCGRDEAKVFRSVKKAIVGMFTADLRQQALQHTRHRVKRTVEYRIDGRFRDINTLEEHIASLVTEINPRGLYDSFCRKFSQYAAEADYRSILRVYNQKTMIQGSSVAGLCGLQGRDGYIRRVIELLKRRGAEARRIRAAIRQAFDLGPEAEARQ